MCTTPRRHRSQLRKALGALSLLSVADPRLAEAEALYRYILAEGRNVLPPGALAVTGFKLGLLLHRQGRLDEARQTYEDSIRICRLQPETTDTQEWALCRCLFRLAELTIRSDRRRAAELFAESRSLALRRRDASSLRGSTAAIRFFRLSASELPDAELSAARPVDLVLGDFSRYKRRPLSTTIVLTGLVLSCAAGTGLVAARVANSIWLAVFAGYCVATLLAPIFSAAPSATKRRMIAIYSRSVAIAVMVAGSVPVRRPDSLADSGGWPRDSVDRCRARV